MATPAPPLVARPPPNQKAAPNRPGLITAKAPAETAAAEQQRAAASTSRQPHSLPVGGAAAAVLSTRCDPELLHDVAFYESIAAELPESDALKSILYSHRHIASNEPTCDELLKEVNQRVERHVEILKEKQSVDLSQQRNAVESAQLRAQRETEERHKQVQSALERAERLLNDMKSPQRVHAENDARADQLRHQREQMERRHADMKKVAESANVEIQDEETLRQRAWEELERANERAAVMMQEAMARGLCLTDEERARIGLSYEKADSRQLVSLLEEHAAGAAGVLRAAEKEFEWCEVWVSHLHERAKRQQRLRELVASLLQHLVESETSHRTIIVSGEHRDRADVEGARAAAFEATTTAATAESAPQSDAAAAQ